jgi:hypothetical protein
MIDTDERVQAVRPDTIPLAVGQQLGVPRFADGPITMGCRYDGQLREIQAGESYCTLSYSNPDTRAKELIRLCESCFTGRSRAQSQRDLSHSRRPVYVTETPTI